MPSEPTPNDRNPFGDAAQTDRPARWKNRLQSGALPGVAAQRRFEPAAAFGRHTGPVPHDARRAAVVALIYRDEGCRRLPLTLRPADLPVHAGQISLPGGLIEPGETSAEAALRELEEELGVSGGEVELLGPLTPLYIFGTRFDVQPWLAVAAARPTFAPNGAEVAEVLEVEPAHWLASAHCGMHRRWIRGIEHTVPHLDWHGRTIWGATAMILGELLALFEEVGYP